MKVAIVGNSGSGKSSHARRLAADHDLPYLELDGIVWAPHQIAVSRPIADVHADLAAFLARHDRWVIEGCDGDLVARTLSACSELVFMNPGSEVCVANNHRRPWEPHKFDSAAAQERMLPFLLSWVRDYYRRHDARSYTYHRELYDRFAGAKREITDLSSLDARAFS